MFLQRVGARSKSIRSALLSLCLVAPPAAAAESTTSDRIGVINAEDLALIDDGRWVIASSMAGGVQKAGSLHAVDSKTGAVFKLYPVAAKAANDERATASGCDTQVAPELFAPHGIAVHTLSLKQQRLFVVNHGGRESIELFDIKSGRTLELIWRGCIPLPKGAMGNAVAITPDHRLFMTNMGRPINGSEPASRWMGDVLAWTEAQGWQTVPDSKIYAPNGLLVSDDGNQFYVASWAAGEVIKLTRSGDDNARMTRQTLSLPFLPDNLRWGDDNTVLATGLRGTSNQVVQCMMANAPCDISIPTGIAFIQADTFNVQCIRNIPLLMGTVSIPVGESLWVGPVRGESIWALAGNWQGGDRCR